MGEDIIRQFLDQVKAQLETDAWYVEHGVPILIENTGDILHIVNSALGAAGISLLLKAPRAEAETPAWRISLELLILENPTLNRARANAATALDTAWHAALALQGDSFSVKRIEHTETEFGFQARAVLEAFITVNP